MAGLQQDTDAIMATGEMLKHEADYNASLEKKDLGSDIDDSFETDSAHEGLEFPTVEELVTLRRVQDNIPWNTYAIAFVELAERFSYYGSSIVFVNYIQQPLPSPTGADSSPNGQAGALGKGQQAANGLNTFYSFWSYFVPLFGAYIADTYWGRYKTTCVSVGIAMLGHVLMIISAIPGIIGGNASFGVFILSMIVTGLGAGMFKANISPLIAEQYRRTKLFIRVLPSGERVIVDPTLTVSRIYMYFYLFINIGALVGQIGMVYAEKYVGYWLAYTLPTIVFMLCIPVLWWGNTHYRKSPPTGSVLAAAVRLWRYAAKGRWSANPVTTIRNLKADDFWENAKPSKHTVESRPAWMTFDDQWVDEVRRGFKACAVFLWYPLYWLAYNQLTSNLTSQAATMSTHGVPNDVLNNLDPFALIIFIPICDLFIYPALARAGIKFTALKKICWGFGTAAFAMVWAAVLQYYLYKTNPCGHWAATCEDADQNPLVSPINVWAQTGSYVLIAFSEIFASITGLEYAFTKAPKNMRSVVMSIFLFQSAFASAIGEAFNPLATDPLLVWNYTVAAILAGVGCVLFWVAVRKLDKQEDALNNLPDSRFDEKYSTS